MSNMKDCATPMGEMPPVFCWRVDEDGTVRFWINGEERVHVGLTKRQLSNLVLDLVKALENK